MRSAEQWLQEYGESHRHATNKTLHWICVPIIVVSLIGLLWSLPTPQAWRRMIVRESACWFSRSMITSQSAPTPVLMP